MAGRKAVTNEAEGQSDLYLVSLWKFLTMNGPIRPNPISVLFYRDLILISCWMTESYTKDRSFINMHLTVMRLKIALRLTVLSPNAERSGRGAATGSDPTRGGVLPGSVAVPTPFLRSNSAEVHVIQQ